MAKISKHELYVEIDGNNTYFAVQVEYASDRGFYAKLDERLVAAAAAASGELLKKCGVAKLKQFKYSGPEFYAVTGDSEAVCVSNAREAFKSLGNATVLKRNVIIVYNMSSKYRNDGFSGFDGALVGMKMEYAEETTLGTEKKYREVRDSEFLGEVRKVYRTVHLHHREAHVIVDDTPENRAFLEGMYSRLLELKGKMDEFLGSRESLESFINTQKQLLG